MPEALGCSEHPELAYSGNQGTESYILKISDSENLNLKASKNQKAFSAHSCRR